MTDHTAHIEACERQATLSLKVVAATLEAVRAKQAEANQLLEESVPLQARADRDLESYRRAMLHAFGIECPNEACRDGQVLIERLDVTRTSPAEDVTDDCETCEGRGMVLPAQAEAYEGD